MTEYTDEMVLTALVTDLPDGLVNLISFLQKIVDDTPEEYRDSLDHLFDVSGEVTGWITQTLDVWYTRELTKEDLEKLSKETLEKNLARKQKDLETLKKLMGQYSVESIKDLEDL